MNKEQQKRVAAIHDLSGFGKCSLTVALQILSAAGIETANTFAVSLTMSQIVVEDDEFIQALMESLETQNMPHWNFQGSLLGRNGSEERVVYKECIPSGQVDIQNVTVGDVIKRNWNFFVNRPPKLQSLLGVDR